MPKRNLAEKNVYAYKMFQLRKSSAQLSASQRLEQLDATDGVRHLIFIVSFLTS